jgi:hypothetical protein
MGGGLSPFNSLRISVSASALYRNRTIAPHLIVGCRVAHCLPLPLSRASASASCCAPPFAGCCVASLGPSICGLSPLVSLPLPSHMPDSLRISVGASALYRNRTVAPHSIVGCHVARLPASASQPAPLPLVAPLRLLVVAWHCWAPPFVGCRLWPPSLSYLTRLHLLAAAAAGGCRQELLPPKPRPRPPPAIVIAIPPSSPHRPGSG